MLEFVQLILNSLPPWLTVISTVLVGYLVYNFARRKNQNYPPGPWGLPIIGYLPFVGRQPAKKFFELGKTYGDVILVSGFGRNMVCLNSYETIKECFSTKGDEFSGRVNTRDDILWFLTDGTGFIREEGAVWKEQRRFALHSLRDLGFGKLSLEDKVLEIGKTLVTALEETKAAPYDPITMLANAAFNVILYLTTDKHFNAEDPDFLMIRRVIQSVLASTSSGLTLLITGALTKFLPNSVRPGFPRVIKAKGEYLEFLSRMIKEHEETLDESNPRDYLDAYLIERKKAHVERKEVTTFTIQRLGSNLLNLLLAGSETTSNTIYWALRILSLNPEIQERLHKELDEVVGQDRLPSIMDRPNLPYTDAFILELLRYSTITPTGVPHTNPELATLKGYNIPPRSIILANIWAVHNDPHNWTEPEKFDPERFMDPTTKDKRRERIVSFAIGKRSCLGESLARMELFLFLTLLLQKFKFEPPEGDSGDFQARMTLIQTVEPYKICARVRK